MVSTCGKEAWDDLEGLPKLEILHVPGPAALCQMLQPTCQHRQRGCCVSREDRGIERVEVVVVFQP